MVLKKKLKRLLFGIAVFAILFVIIFFAIKNGGNGNVFSKTFLIKTNIPFGNEIQNTLRINNPTEETIDFEVFFEGLEGIAFSEEKSFSLNPGKYKEVVVDFKGTQSPGVYFGSFVINGHDKTEKIPVVIGIEDPDNSFALVHETIPKYENPRPGENFGLEIKLFDLLNRSITSVTSQYSIKNFNGDVFLQGNSDLVVGGSTVEIIHLPKDLLAGNYVFISTIDYENVTSFSTYLFSIQDKEIGSFFYDFRFLVAITFGMLFLVFLILYYFIGTRDELLVQLKKQQSAELRSNLKYFGRSQKAIAVSKEKPKVKKAKLERLKTVKEKVIKKIKKKQGEQKKEVTKLKKAKKKGTIKTKLGHWEKEGYKMFDTKKEVQNITKAKQISDWKKGGYNTSLLNK